MINLSELEQKAKAATFVDMRDGMRAYTAMEFNEAMSPTTAIALIRVVRAAQYIVTTIRDGVNIGEYRHMHQGDVQVDGDRWIALNEALKEIEA